MPKRRSEKLPLKPSLVRVLVGAACVLGLVTGALPLAAFADYSNPSLHATAQMQTNGDLHVTEQRTFDFQEDYSVITWAFTGLSAEQEVSIEAVRITQVDAEGNMVRDRLPVDRVSFQSSWRDFVGATEGVTEEVDEALARSERTSDDAADNVALPLGDAYALDERRNVLYLFMHPTSLLTTVECDYVISDAVALYDDVAELYWDYVEAKDDVVTDNVSVQIQLPVPEGIAVVPGENVMAWGHGPEGTIDIKPDGTINYEVAQVREGGYAQAHLIFPVAWLNNLTVQQKIDKSGLRFDDAMAAEEAWADTYTAGRINDLILSIVVLGFCALVLAASAVGYLLFGREKQPSEACDVDASDYDAAVLGRLMRWDRQSTQDFAATLQQLADKGVITITQSGSDVRFRVAPKAKGIAQSPLEREAMRMVFDMVGDGYQSVSLDDICDYCKRHAPEAGDALRSWQRMLSKDVARAGLFDRRSVQAAKAMAVVAVLLVVYGIVRLAGGISIPGIALVVTGVATIAIAYHMPRRTQTGSDLTWYMAQSCHEDDDQGNWQERLAVGLDQACMADKGAERKGSPWARAKRRAKTT